MNKNIKSSLIYISLSIIPVIFLLFLIESGFKINNSSGVYLGILLLALFIIANPIYLTILSKHFLSKHNINFALSIIMPIVFGIGSVLILNKNRWFGRWDPINDIIFIVELIIVGVILLIGLSILIYLKFKKI